MGKEQSNRREFLRTCARGAGVATVGATAFALAYRADADRVWQLDPTACTTCEGLVDRASIDSDGWGYCATECVLELSAVKAVNQFDQCGYCYNCPAYYDVTSEDISDVENPSPDDHVYKGRICPLDAITRRQVGEFDAWDPESNFYKYTIDESKCNGCGRCVVNCKPPWGNASLRLEVRHDLCADCNQCNIAMACPQKAFFRSPLTGRRPGYKGSAAGVKKEHS